MRYTFGDSLTAAERLRRIAVFFNPLASDFIKSHLDAEVKHTADLGCGPGFTTGMLADATRANSVTGFDQSEAFLKEARRNFPNLSFEQADVNHIPGQKKYDVIYCRFLLSHLKNIPVLLQHWVGLLVPGGKLFIDELETIETVVPVFKKYLQISNGLVSSQGADLYIGKQLDTCVEGLQVESISSDRHDVLDGMAAGWFYPNTVGAWKESGYIQERVTEEEIVEISQELETIHQADTGESHITWKMKRIVITT